MLGVCGFPPFFPIYLIVKGGKISYCFHLPLNCDNSYEPDKLNVLKQERENTMIRKASAMDWKGIARVHADCILSAYEGILPPETLQNFSYNNREKRWEHDLPKTISGGTMNYVAENEQGAIVGFALGGTMRDPRLRIRYSGEIYGIYVHPSYQHQGLGKKLFTSVIDHLASLHHSKVALWTFKDSPSTSFFASLGGEEVYEKNTTIGGKQLTEVAYGWENDEKDQTL